MTRGPLDCPCGGEHLALVHRYTEAPAGEVRFAFSAAGKYAREILRCQVCGHFISRHEMDASGMYAGQYVSATYGDEQGLRRAFQRIIDLDPSRSDNSGRVRRVLDFAGWFLPGGLEAPKILDVGSGLGVFLHRMNEAGWQCTALDPDPRSTEHARSTVGVHAVCGDFMTAQGLGRFDAISFNKVLEHVERPVEMLRKAGGHLLAHGFVYIEVPDGEGAKTEGYGREEFFIDHLHVFSPQSLAMLIERAGFRLVALETLREPSAKFTLRGFAAPR